MTIEEGNRKIKPGKIVCVGRNYVEHIRELGNEIPGEMVLFMKPSTSITGELVSVHCGEPLHYECEICFLFEKGGFSRAAIGLDLTKRGLQSRLKEKGLPWERAKGFDGAALFSPFVPFDGDYSRLSLVLEIDGNTVQSASTDLMMYKPDEIQKEITSFITLEDGDIVMTGTPAGVGTVEKGKVFRGILLEGGTILSEKSWTVSN
ncbi:fumarylacetoacetate hydrolase family protein [Spirochaeta isovalerica]|uniref:2-keto-4-pentenoate hydratase/2-oxohepta-3-ene-1,7-dioic acid hydratase in catechol pathway n=1 Tax=Spirochaeta isovalerica TaxID=150 RepID=A0A841RC40_9SPIO|nr:fumarylacetoacetate hydrolase family protein [Spirochaeta isovalerica]MBB6480570.1 2-keto-4-pentenoate hydratase/2-oxohepta-3-ene-1,7-dioic acid hydratase in catechol pathway [Spirochaeta isovalerica]